ncbi:hypothetical protein Q7C36_021923 [Tachysurus vachellii]|uniref:Neuron-specific protein family member 1 n=1 Tax=Tachysurus vachellii TaxID=175792 RepID=A0AA88LQ17_TACVA|nr:hypothetical protein Q7C36_021923 [Tachysurus vachellii]
MECACAVPSTDAASADSGIATVTVLLRSAAPTFVFAHFLKNLPHGTTTSLPSRKIDMVKLGSTLGEKVERELSLEDGFDNIPLITPLEVNQLQKPFPDKVIVKTTTEYQLQKKQKKKLYMPSIKKLNINLYDEVTEKVKVTGLILITLTFLACLLLLVMYKALWYDQLSCPEGFILKHKHCTPAALEMYYPEQDAGSRGSLYTAISHLNPAKKVLPELSSPWLPVINAMKESQKAKGEASHSQQ